MRVLHIISSMGGGGAERQLAYLASALREQGVDVHVALLLGGPNLNRLEAGGATLHWLNAKYAYSPQVIFQLQRLVKSVQPDILQAWNTPFDIYCGVLRLFGGRPWVFCERSKGPWNPRMIGMLPLGYLPTTLRMLAARTATAIVTNSSVAENAWGRFWGRNRLRRIIRNALPLAEINASLCLEPTELDCKRPIIVCAGRLHKEKNWEVLIQALRITLEQKPATIYLLGDGDEREHIKDMVAAYGLIDKILFKGYVGDIWSWLKTADLLISISRYEGQPNIVLEAMACGCPLLLSAIPSHREAVPAADAVFIDDFNNPDAVASALLDVLAAPAVAVQRAASARERCRGRSPEHMATAYIDLYNEILRNDG